MPLELDRGRPRLRGASKEHLQDGRGVKRPTPRGSVFLSSMVARIRALYASYDFGQCEWLSRRASLFRYESLIQRWIVATFLASGFACGVGASSPKPVQLPVEVTGVNGTEVGIHIAVPHGFAGQIRTLWMQVHGLQYDDMASVRINECVSIPLNNRSAKVDEPGKRYGGIGGGFSTLKLSVPLLTGCTVDGDNVVHFRFNHTNGVVSGYRILAFNFLTSDGQLVLPPETFVEEDPNTWVSPLPDAENIASGKSLWERAGLKANGLAGAGPIRAHCADCHTKDGRDLKYFNYSNASIVARSRFHGLSEMEGRQIASYIRSLKTPNPGRPWNPPYQPGRGLDDQPVANWAAGAGISAVLAKDSDTLIFLFPARGVIGEVFRPDGNLNPREIPIAIELPDWNHWLPRVHPMDAFGKRFDSSVFAQMYEHADYAKLGSDAAAAEFFEAWTKARAKFLTPHLTAGSKRWNAELAEQFYASQLWELVKAWEMIQNLKLEERRTWLNTIPAATAPTAVNIPDSAAGMGGSGLTNEYFSSAWYQLQVELNSGNHRHHGRSPVDWVYLIEHFRDLQHFSGEPEPGRLLITVVKALQSTDPGIGPQNIAEGWRPEQTVDPRILVDAEWASTFALLDAEDKRRITQALLTAWLDKNLQYAPAEYFQLGLSASSYARPVGLDGISGGKAWQAAPQFRAAGVDPKVVQQLEAWGQAYTSLAALFHY